MPKVTFPVIIFIIVLYLPWLCNPLKHFSHDFHISILHFFPVSSQLCVLHNLSCFHAHVFISPHPLIYSLSNLLILDPEYTLTLLMLQSPTCFDDAYVFQLPSPMCVRCLSLLIAFSLLQLFLPHFGVV